MDGDAKTTIVDLVMQRPASEIDTTSDDISEKLIALECGHIFTVETLDDNCGMREYYEIDPMTGRYLDMKAPPVEYQTPPVCPTCRGPITSPRYGRITKRANLDILEQNVESNMSKQLERHGPTLGTITAGLEASATAAKGIIRGVDFASKDRFAQICEKRKDSFGKPDQPLPAKMLRELKALHGFSLKEAEQWAKITREISRVYGAITSVTAVRPGHVKAYEAAMTTLFELEMEAIALDPSKADGRTQREVASAAANAKIGQPPHKADRKYRVEAFLLTIKLRLMLAKIASVRISGLPLISKEPNHDRHRQIWITFVGFLYESCIKDCEKAISLALSYSALRQEARVSMVNLRCTFEKVRFDALEERRRIQIPAEGQLEARERLGEVVSQHKAEAQQALMQARTRYFQDRPVNSPEQVNKEDVWFQENCVVVAEKVFTAYEVLQVQVLKLEVFYQPMSLDEKREIPESSRAFGMERGSVIHPPSHSLYSVQVTVAASLIAGMDIPSLVLRYADIFQH